MHGLRTEQLQTGLECLSQSFAGLREKRIRPFASQAMLPIHIKIRAERNVINIRAVFSKNKGSASVSVRCQGYEPRLRGISGGGIHRLGGGISCETGERDKTAMSQTPKAPEGKIPLSRRDMRVALLFSLESMTCCILLMSLSRLRSKSPAPHPLLILKMRLGLDTQKKLTPTNLSQKLVLLWDSADAQILREIEFWNKKGLE